MKPVAVLGANGFIGNHVVEAFHRRGFQVVTIVRRASALALPARFALDSHIADAHDGPALVSAFGGVDAVVTCISGAPETLIATVTPVYRAAAAAGVRRIIFLSSASVHGQAHSPGTNEASQLSLRQPFAYNRAKILAERRLLALARAGSVEVVILRPGIVYGPRSQWTGGLADQILSGEAFLADGGRGVCNAIYVGNLVHAIERAILAEGVNGEAYLLNDREPVTWRDLAAPIAGALGVDLHALPQPDSSVILARREPSKQRFVRSLAKSLLYRLPPHRVEALRAARRAWRGAEQRPDHVMTYSRELALLHSNRVSLPIDKAVSQLQFDPCVSFADGCRRSVEWLTFAGYPVRR